MKDLPRRFRFGLYSCTGRIDYDNGRRCGKTHTHKRTIKRFKKQKYRILMKIELQAESGEPSFA